MKKIFTKKKQKPTKTNLECKVHFKKKFDTPKVKRRQELKKIKTGFTIKPQKKKNINTRLAKVKRKQTRERVMDAIFIALVLISSALFFYLIITFVTNTRGRTTVDDITSKQSYVLGIDNVPVYPNSEFIYEDKEEESAVQNMLSKGISVYRIPPNVRTQEIYNFYQENLVKYGWEHIKTVTTSTEEELFGQYWVEKNKGLRIHVQNTDLWYETITKEEAKNCLKERRERELQRQRILESSGHQLLLPHYSWALEIPHDYIISYFDTKIDEKEGVEILELKTSHKYYIEPVGPAYERTFDEYLEGWIEKKDKKDNKRKWEIVTRRKDSLYEHEIYSFVFSKNSEQGEGILIIHLGDDTVYAFYTTAQEQEFFNYLIKNIQAR